MSSKIKIDKKELHRLYMLEVDEICEVCDWKTDFGPEEIVHLIGTILEKHPELIKEVSKTS
jgi:hypothetical protein